MAFRISLQKLSETSRTLPGQLPIKPIRFQFQLHPDPRVPVVVAVAGVGLVLVLAPVPVPAALAPVLAVAGSHPNPNAHYRPGSDFKVIPLIFQAYNRAAITWTGDLHLRSPARDGAQSHPLTD